MTAHSLTDLRAAVLAAHQELARLGLAPFTFGNASAIDRASGHVVIKPSGVPYDSMTAADMVVTDLEGKVVEGSLRPSSDLATHIELYRAFKEIGGIVHTHSHYATSWAQSLHEISLPRHDPRRLLPGARVTDGMSRRGDRDGLREEHWARDRAPLRGLDPMEIPAVLVAEPRELRLGPDGERRCGNGGILEEIASMAYHALTLDPAAKPSDSSLLDKHFLRKHGRRLRITASGQDVTPTPD